MNLIERELELTTLRRLFAESADGRGKVVVIGGTVASGKSALLRVFAEHAVAAGALFLDATASPAERQIPLSVVRRLFRDVGSPSSVPLPALAVAKGLLDEQIGTRIGGPLATQTGDRIGIAVSGEGDPRADATAQTTWPVLQELCRLLLGVAAQTPLVIAIDDVHHADTASLRFLSYAAHRVKSARILMVLGERIGARREHPWFHADLLSQPHCRRLRLRPLSRRGQVELLRTRLDLDTAHAFSSICDAVTGGNPLLVQALLQDDRAVPPPGAPSGDPAELPVGDTFPQAALTCLRRSGPKTQRVARALAVLRDPAAPELVGGLLELDAECVVHAIDVMDAAGLLDGGRFRHPAVRTAVLDAMASDERAALHGRAARLLHERGAAPMAVAEHLLAAAESSVRSPARAVFAAMNVRPGGHGTVTGESWQVPVLEEAAEQACADGAVHTALACLRLAHETCPDERRRARIAMAVARVEWRIDPATVARLLPGLVAAVRDGRLDVRHAVPLPGYLMWHGRVGEAVEVRDLITARSQEPCTHVPAGWLTATRLLMACVYPGVIRDATPDRDAAAEGPPAGEATRRLRAAAALSAALTGEPVFDAPGAAEQVLQGARLAETSPGWVLSALAALIYDDHPRTAARWCDPLLAEAAARHEPLWHATLAAARAVISIREGDIAGAAEHARVALARISPASWGVAIGVPVAAAVYAATALGGFEDAATYLGVAVPEAMFQTPCGLHYLQARGRFRLATGHPDTALDDFLTCGERMRAWGFDVPGLVSWRSDAAQALVELGDVRRAAHLADEQLAMVRHRASRTRGLSLRVRALASADPRHRTELLTEAVTVLERCGDRYELALALDDLDRAEQEQGDTPATAQTSERAGAVPSEATPRSRAPAPAGTAAALTAAERRIAALVVEGRTNRQIADTLVITISTVEQHLTRIYRKLGVTRRADLARRLRAGTGDRLTSRGGT